MAVEKRCERFVRLICKRIISDEKLNRKEQKDLFKHSVSNVKNHEMKVYLLENYAYYRQLFLSFLEDGGGKEEGVSPIVASSKTVSAMSTTEDLQTHDAIASPSKTASNCAVKFVCTDTTNSPLFAYNLFTPTGKLDKKALNGVDTEKKEKLYSSLRIRELGVSRWDLRQAFGMMSAVFIPRIDTKHI